MWRKGERTINKKLKKSVILVEGLDWCQLHHCYSSSLSSSSSSWDAEFSWVDWVFFFFLFFLLAVFLCYFPMSGSSEVFFSSEKIVYIYWGLVALLFPSLGHWFSGYARRSRAVRFFPCTEVALSFSFPLCVVYYGYHCRLLAKKDK